MTGTLVNAGAIVLGAGVGTLLGHRLDEGVRTTVTHALGIFVIVLGISDALGTFGDQLSGALGSASVLVILGALLLGGVLGELLGLEDRLHQLGEWLRDRVVGGSDHSGPSTDPGTDPGTDPRRLFVEGFVVTTLIVCVGPLAILGSLQDGLTDGFELLAVKSMLDGFAALAFAAVLGIGVAFAALPLLLLQGAITLAATGLQTVLTPTMLAALTATGGFLVIGVGLRLTDLLAVRVANLLPALVLAPLAVALWP